MGNSHVGRGRLTPAIVIVVVVLALVAFAAMVGATKAQALPTFNTADLGIGPCDSCHTLSTVHAPGFPAPGTNANHASVGCSTCHNNGGTSNPPLPTACASCHTKATILASAKHTSLGCGTAGASGGCHASAPAPTPVTTIMTAKVAPTTVKLNKSVTISGTVTPAAQLAGAKVTILVNRKSGTKWVKAKSTTATASATGGFSWKYKVTKKASYQVKVSVKATPTYTAKTVTKTFKAK
jgi:hypothetical protein